MVLLDFERFELIKELLKNRLRIVWCMRLARAEVGVSVCAAEWGGAGKGVMAGCWQGGGSRWDGLGGKDHGAGAWYGGRVLLGRSGAFCCV